MTKIAPPLRIFNPLKHKYA